MRLFRPGDRRRRGRAGDRLRVAFVLVILLLLEFYLRPSIVAGRHGLPDFLVLVRLLLAMREEPGVAALTGFLIGLVIDVMNPARFGAGMLANVLVTRAVWTFDLLCRQYPCQWCPVLHRHLGA